MIPFLLLMSINSFVTIFGASLLPAFLTDIADYNSFSLGRDVRSLTVSVGAMSITVASLLGGGIAAFGLDWIGFDASVPAQAVATARSVTDFMLLGGAAFALTSIFPMLLYRLNEKQMWEIHLSNQTDRCSERER